MSKTVVILGTGATRASNYKKCGEPLPGDRGFFDNKIVKIKIEDFPALKIMLKFFTTKTFENKGIEENYESNEKKLRLNSLESFWTFLDFCNHYKKIYDLKDEKEEWWKEVNKNKGKKYDLDKLHCNAKKYINTKSMQTNNDYSKVKLTLMAGWELRLLISEVYAAKKPRNDDDTYLKLIKKLVKNNSDGDITFISLNYDCLLEASLDGSGKNWFYPCIKSHIEKPPKIKILKLHGSLNWKMQGNLAFDIASFCCG